MNAGLLFILGFGVFGGMIGAYVFQKIKFPQVVGYIVIGLFFGDAVLGLVTKQDIVMLRPFNYFALGVIGFLVGGELKIGTFRKYAKQFTMILLGEGLLAFFLVGGLTAGLLYLIKPDVSLALAGGAVFGAIASATDPASTVDVLWEYRSQGVMTTAIIAVVALDDALAMTLYGIGTSCAQMLTGGSGSITHELLNVSREIFGAIALGGAGAGLLAAFMKWVRQPERTVAMATGMILLVISIALYLKMDVILAGMTMGFVLTNVVPYRSEDLFKLMRSFSIPIYVLFFVLVGARLGFKDMTWWLWVIVALYVIGRSVGKMLGARLGAKISNCDTNVKKYLGMSLFAQGGVAVGLSIVAAQHLNNIEVKDGLSLGDAIIFAVTATTLVVQLIGPAMVKLAIKLAGESGRNITEEDVMETMLVSDVVDEKSIMINEFDPVQIAVELFRDNDRLLYPVVNKDGKLTGILSFESLKNILADRDSWQWLLAADVMTPVVERTTMNKKLSDVYREMQQMKVDQLPVVSREDWDEPVGVVDMRNIKIKLHAELIKRRSQGSDALQPA